MDSASDWAAHALFSPSKARAQQAQAKDWAAVESWLSKRYGTKRPPPFEKNEETLQSLLALANLNDSADEHRSQLERVEKNVIQNLSKQPSGLAHDVLQAMLSQADVDECFETIAEIAVALNTPTADLLAIGKDLSQLISDEFEAKQRLMVVSAQVEALQAEQKLLTESLDELGSKAFQTPSDTIENTAQWLKSTKHLKAKLAEYDERLAAIPHQRSPNRLAQMQQKIAEVERHREALALLESQLKVLQTLPPDMRSARKKLEDARNNLQNLTAKRDQLFEALAG